MPPNPIGQPERAELDHSAGGVSPEILLQDRLTKGRERLDNALEAIAMLCEPVEPPKRDLDYIQYFGRTGQSRLQRRRNHLHQSADQELS